MGLHGQQGTEEGSAFFILLPFTLTAFWPTWLGHRRVFPLRAITTGGGTNSGDEIQARQVVQLLNSCLWAQGPGLMPWPVKSQRKKQGSASPKSEPFQRLTWENCAPSVEAPQVLPLVHPPNSQTPASTPVSFTSDNCPGINAVT